MVSTTCNCIVNRFLCHVFQVAGVHGLLSVVTHYVTTLSVYWFCRKRGGKASAGLSLVMKMALTDMFLNTSDVLERQAVRLKGRDVERKINDCASASAPGNASHSNS